MSNELYTSGPANFTEQEMANALFMVFRLTEIPVFETWQDHDKQISVRGMTIGKRFKIVIQTVTDEEAAATEAVTETKQ